MVLTRRGRYLGGYLRTVATLTPNESNTEVTITFTRPKETRSLMVGFVILGGVTALAGAIPIVSNGLSASWQWSNLFVLSPLVSFGVIFAVNHISAMDDAMQLHKEIVTALTQPPKNFWRTLPKQS